MSANRRYKRYRIEEREAAEKNKLRLEIYLISLQMILTAITIAIFFQT